MSSATSVTNHDIPPPSGGCPLRLGAPADFARVRALLADAGYDQVTLCRVLAIADIADLVRVNWDNIPLDSLPPQLRLCLTLFVRTQPTPETEAAATWGAETLAAFLALGLLRRSRQHGQLVSTVWLSPVDGFIVASDLSIDPDGGDFQPFDDAVFPAIERVTLGFLRLLPDARNRDALDLCGGSGIGALHLARTARVAVTADLTARSAFFAAFNGRLNDVPIVSRCGDLYDAVEGRQFDLISAHPPYVPDIGQRAIYRDGGEAGETVTHRAIEGLRRHLRVGGMGVVVGFARDTHAQPFEQRARAWLGEAAAEFDVIFGVDGSQSIEQVVEGQRHRLNHDADRELQRLSERLRDLDTRQFVHGVLFLRRYATAVTAQPLRVHITPKASAVDFERLFAWRERRRQPGFHDWLAATRPRLAPQLGLHTHQTVQDGRFVVSETLFRIEHAFESVLRPESWIVPAISRLNGQPSVAEVFAAAHAAGEWPEEFPLQAFVGLIDTMVERGFLELNLPDQP